MVALSRIGNNIVARYQRRLYAHLMALCVGYFYETRSAQLAAQVSQNVGGIRDVLNLTVTSIARDLLTLIGLVGVMFFKDWLLSFIVFVAAPPLLLGLRYVSKRLRSVTREAIDVNSRVLGAMQETIQGIAIVKAFTMEGELRGKVETLVDRAENRANRIARLCGRTAPMTETFAGLAISAVLAYSAFRAIYADVPPGAFFSFVVALLLAYDPARRLARLQVSLERAVVNARMVYELLDMVPRQRDNADAKELAFTNAAVELRDVCFRYPSGDEVLEGVSFVAEGGKTTALVGPSGAGKSTVISLIPRFFDIRHPGRFLSMVRILPTSPSSRFARASPMCRSSRVSLRRHDPRQHPLRPASDATDAEVEDAARLAYAHEFILAQPQRLRHAGRRERRDAVGRPAPATVDRPGARPQRPDPAARRGYLRARYRIGGRRAEGARPRDGPAARRSSSSPIDFRPSSRADKIVVMQQGSRRRGRHPRRRLRRRQRTGPLYARLHNLQGQSSEERSPEGEAPEAPADAEIRLADQEADITDGLQTI